jgi:hypothetical protein
MSLVMNPSEGGNDGYGYGGTTYYGGELVQTQGDAVRGRNPDQDSGDEFLSEMARIRQDQTGEAAPPTPGRYKQKLEAARQESAEPDNTGYRYPGYKARRRESLSAEDEPSSTPAPAVPTGGSRPPSLCRCRWYNACCCCCCCSLTPRPVFVLLQTCSRRCAPAARKTC